MIPDVAVIALTCFWLGWVIGSMLYVWWRLRRVRQELYRVAWDLEALAGALRSREEKRGQ
jgi:hypothetical protein